MRQFEQGGLTRRQLVQGLLVAAAVPVAAQQPPAGAFRAAGIDHVQITVDDLKGSQQFYEKLLGVAGRSNSASQVNFNVGTTGNFIAVQSGTGRIKPIDHFAIAVENFSPETALAAIERAAPGTKAEKSGNSVFVTAPEGVRVQIQAATRPR
ncbi:MAG TPA: VOC family protein [Bryobacteraceae bacterium]|nr:VOC family protein [Bryobacteraceae bacterium]